MKRIINILFAGLFLFSFRAQAQDTIPVDSIEEVSIQVLAPMPEFPGGREALFEYLAKNIHYPEIEWDADSIMQVIAQFSVQVDGSITEVEVVRSLDGYPDFDEEVIRVISGMPKWIWAKEPGKYAPVRYTIPINLRLQ